MTEENTDWVLEETPEPNLEQVLIKKVKKPRMFIAENCFEIHEGDPGWVPEFSGKVVYRRNSGLISSDVTTVIENVETPVDLHNAGDPPYTLYMYIPFGILFNYVDGLGTSMFPKRFIQEIEIFSLDECIVKKESKTIPVCKHMICSGNSSDPALELYDYPFTLLPLRDSCSSEKLGRSVKAVEYCPHSKEGTFDSCSAYEGFQPVEIGHVNSSPVILSRTFVDYEIVHNYNYEEQNFNSYKELKEYFEQNNLVFELTWSPLAAPVSFFETIIGNLEITYPQNV